MNASGGLETRCTLNEQKNVVKKNPPSECVSGADLIVRCLWGRQYVTQLLAKPRPDI